MLACCTLGVVDNGVYAQARWNAEGLQSDALSLENGAIMSNASRWPLIIDPQLQGRHWIVSKETDNNLCILQQSQSKYVDTASLSSNLSVQSLLNGRKSEETIFSVDQNNFQAPVQSSLIDSRSEAISFAHQNNVQASHTGRRAMTLCTYL